MERRFSVLIADDHEFFRQWLRDRLQRDFPEVERLDETADPLEAAEMATANAYDLVLLDIDFAADRSINGIDVAEKIWKKHAHTGVILVTNYNAEIYVRKLYRVCPPTCVYGYLLKEEISKGLAFAVKAVLSGDCWIDPDVARLFSRIARKDTSLTDNEYEVLVCIALGLSDHAAARVLCLTEKAIQARLQLLYSKFGISSRGEHLYNPRCRAIWCGFKRGLINEIELNAWAQEIKTKNPDTGLSLEF